MPPHVTPRYEHQTGRVVYKLRSTASISFATNEASSEDESNPANLLVPDHSAGVVDQTVTPGGPTAGQEVASL